MRIKRYILMIDFSTNNLRVYIIDSLGNIVIKEESKIEMIINPDYPFIIEYDTKFIREIFFKIIKDVMKEAKKSNINIEAISCVAQRIGTVFIDKNFNEIYMGPNSDSRGIFVDFPINEEEIKRIYEITGHTPLFIFSPMRFLWFKENKMEMAKKISKILTLHDWIIHKLTGNSITEPSIASDTLLFDINKREWSKYLLDLFGVDIELLPEVKNAGDFAGEIEKEVARKTGLPKNLPVFVGGGDTHFGLLAAGLMNEKHYGCVAGYTSPVAGITNKPIIDKNMKVWAGCHIFPNKWIIESNAGFSGGLVDWFIKSFLFSTSLNPYRYFEKLVESSEIGAKGMRMRIGSMIMNAKNMVEQKMNGFILLKSPNIPFIKPARIEDFARSILETIAFTIKANLKQLIEISNIKLEYFGITGGLTRFKSFLKILSNVLGSEIQVSKKFYGSMLACAILTFKNIAVYSSFEEAFRNMANFYIIKPNNKKIQIYNEIFLDWLDFYKTIDSIGI